MAKLTQAEIKEKADKWAGFENRITKILAQETAALAAAEEEFNRQCEEIRDSYALQTGPLQVKADAIEKEVVDWLEANGKPISLAGVKAIAAYEITPAGTVPSGRVCDPRLFIKTAEAAKKDPFPVLKVLLQEADTLLGKDTMAKICTAGSKAVPETRSAYLKLK